MQIIGPEELTARSLVAATVLVGEEAVPVTWEFGLMVREPGLYQIKSQVLRMHESKWAQMQQGGKFPRTSPALSPWPFPC